MALRHLSVPRRALVLLVAIALVAIGAPRGYAYEAPNAAFAGGVSAMAGSGLTQTWVATGATTLSGGATTAGSKGYTATLYSPAVATATASESVVTGVSGCPASGPCTGLGSITVTFSHPVVNPVFHVAGLGGAVASGGNGSVFHATLTLTSPALPITKVGVGTNSTVAGSMITAVNDSTSASCTSVGTTAAALSACGSFQVTGTVTTATFDIGAVAVVYAGSGLTTGGADEFLIFATVDQDFGDAPATYEVGNAARAVTSDLRLGSAVTAENTGTLNAVTSPNSGTGSGDSDDGAAPTFVATVATTYSTTVSLSGASSAGQVCGWVDVTKNGVFDSSERACQAVAIGQTSATLSWSGLSGLSAGTTYARFRVGYNTAQTQSPTGPADSGEVEDYQLPIVVLAIPTASPDPAATLQGVPVTVDPLTNDTADARTALDPTSVKLMDGATPVTTLTIAGQGTYTVDPVTGKITFTPLPTFTGVATPVTYRASDLFGQPVSSTLAVTVTAIAPTAAPDTRTTPFDTNATVAVLSNDSAGNTVAPLVPATVQLRDPATGTYGASVTVPGEGTYTVNTTTAEVTFDPLPTFSGVATAVTYRVADTNGTLASSTLTITVSAPPPPAPADDSTTTPQGVAVTLPTLGNDVLSPLGASLVPASVVLADPVSGLFQSTVAVAGEGTWTINATTGDATFTPLAGFVGVATPITYRVTDANGATDTAVERVTVTAVTPGASLDIAGTAYETSIGVPVLANDSAGNPLVPLSAASVQLKDPADGTYTSSVAVVGVGSYVVQPDGSVVFSPAQGYSGTTPQLGYRVADANGTYALSTLAVTVSLPPAPVANPDTDTTPQGVPVTVSELGNDTSDPASPLSPTSVKLLDASTPVTTLTVPGQGTYTVDAVTGTITFAPLPSFSGPATPVSYQVTDESGQTANSTVTVTVTTITPAAVADATTTPFNHPVNVPVLGNDTAGAATALLVPASVQVKDSDGTWKSSVTLPGVGTFVVQPDGSMTFTPAAGYSGTTPALPYRVADSNGTTAASTITITVTDPPRSDADSANTPQGIAVTLNPLDNDTAGTGASLVATSVMLLSGTTPVSTLTVPGQGTYSVNPTTGEIAFTPLATFSGLATPVSYQVTDSDGNTSASTIGVSVTPIVPTVTPDTATTPFAHAINVAVLGNDHEGAATAPLDSGTVRIQDTDGSWNIGITKAGVGTFAVQPDGSITFTPAPGYTGTAPALPYRVADTNGTTVAGTLTITVTAPPKSNLDSAATPQGIAVTVDPLSNDTAGTGASLLPTTVRLLDGATAVTSLTVPGEGTYAVDPITGKVTFTPLPTFSGTATPVGYQVTDTDGNTSASTIGITVAGVIPVATADTATTPYKTAVTVPLLGNDNPGDASVPLVPASVQLQDTDGTWKSTVTLANVGTFALQPDSSVLFTPVQGFAGPTPALPYRVADANGTVAQSTVIVTVTAPPAPVATPDTATTPQGVVVIVTLSANDTSDPSSPLSMSSIRILENTGTYRRNITVPGEGSYSVDPVSGHVTFTPLPTFTGTTTPVSYRIADEAGTRVYSTVTITVMPVTPVATADTVTTPFAHAVAVPVLGNDAAGAVTAPLDPASVLLKDTDGSWKAAVSLPGVGTFAVQPDGTVTFTPAGGFTGATPAVAYRVADANGTLTQSTVTVTVGAAPLATPDTSATPQGLPVTVNPLATDTPGTGGSFVPGSVGILDPADLTYKSSVTIAGQGTYTVNPATGEVTFAPVPAFTGPATSVGYTFTDSDGNSATSTITITVTPVTPVATPDAGTTPYETPITVALVGDDTAGNVAVPLVPASVQLKDTDGTWKGTITLAGVGTFVVQPGGSVTFSPVQGYTGTTPAVAYRVADANGTLAQSTVEVTVSKPPAPEALSDTVWTPQGVAVTLDVLANDSSDAAAPLAVASVKLLDPADGTYKTSVTIPGEGTYTVNATTGAVTFAPIPAFTGVATAITYEVADEAGQVVTATITVTVDVIIPDAAPNSATTPYSHPVNLPLLGNDSAGGPSAPLVPGSVELQDPADGMWKTTVSLPGVGTFVVLPDGSATFTPTAGYTGTTPNLPYRVADTNGTFAQSTATVTVQIAPTASPDAAGTLQGQPVTVSPLGNDTPGGAATIVPTSVRVLDPADGTYKASVTIPGQGAYTATASGDVTFAPLPAFTGPATPVTYRFADSDGNVASSTIAVTVTAVTPAALPDNRSTPFAHPVTVVVLGNDSAGDPAVPLVPGSVQLQDPVTSSWVTTLTVAGTGTYAVQPDGSVLFTPAAGYTGSAPALTYHVADANGTLAVSTISIVVGAAPVAAGDVATTLQHVSVVLDTLANDHAGTAASLLPASVELLDPATSTYGPSVTVPGQGTFTLDPATGKVTFSPVPTFTGPATPIPYRVSDSDGNRAAATLTVTVTPVVPGLLADAVATPYNQPVTVPVLGNDLAGDGTAPLVPTSVELKDPADGTWSATVTIPGEGSFAVQPDGTVLFTPAAGYEGDVTTVDYRVADTNGTLATSTVHVFIGDAPVAAPDTATTAQGKPVTLPLLSNDAPGTGGTLTPGSTQLLDPSDHVFKAAVTLPGEGTWTVDPATGSATFAPVGSFVGVTAPITYQVLDSHGTIATSAATVTVTAVTPVATDDTATTPFRTPLVVSVLTNDHPGRGDTPLDPGTLQLKDPATGTWSTSVTVAGVGAWLALPDGTVVFTPDESFEGTTVALPYRVADSNGTLAASTLAVTVDPPYGAAAQPNTGVGKLDVPVTLPVLNNDAPSNGATWVATSVCLVPESASVITGMATATCPKSVSLAGKGSWLVNPDGTVTFTPEPGFTGTASIGYTVTDTNGVTVASTLQVSFPKLSNTGGPGLLPGVVGLLLVLGGGLAILLARRRRDEES